MTTTVRNVTADDKASWSRLWESYLTFYETELDASVYEMTWARIMDEGEKMFAAVAEDGEGRIIGIVNYLYHRNFWGAADVCYLNDLFVDPAVRGSGAGRAMITAVKNHSTRDGICEVYWLTAKDNARAKRLYDSVVEQYPFDVYLIET